MIPPLDTAFNTYLSENRRGSLGMKNGRPVQARIWVRDELADQYPGIEAKSPMYGSSAARLSLNMDVLRTVPGGKRKRGSTLLRSPLAFNA